MPRILTICSGEKNNASLRDLLSAGGFSADRQLQTAGEARALLKSDSDFDLILLNTPLSGEDGCDLAIFLSQQTDCPLLLLARPEALEGRQNALRDAGIAVLEKPLSRVLFVQLVTVLTVLRRRTQSLQSENRQLRSTIEEMRLIDRAKCVLIQYLTMTEPQAHRYIEKQAMDLRLSKVQVARQILNTYES